MIWFLKDRFSWAVVFTCTLVAIASAQDLAMVQVSQSTPASSALPAKPAKTQTQSLVGEWHWNANWQGHANEFSDTLEITTQKPDGTFSGRLTSYRGRIKGSISGDQIQYIRSWNDGKLRQQHYKATLVGEDQPRMVKGTWTGYGGSLDNQKGEFSAEKIPSTLPPRDFRPCFVNSGSVGSAGPCVLAPGSLLWVQMSRQLPNPPASLTFRAIVTSGVPAAVSSPLVGSGDYYHTTVPTQLCATGTGGKWDISLFDSTGQPWGNIGQLTVDCRAFQR